MAQLPPARRGLDPGVFLGAGLVAVGLLALAVEYVPVPGFDLARYGWPFVIVVAGLLLIAFGATVRGASGMAVPGGIVLMVGAVLAVQDALGAFQTWAYAWALVAPGGVGLGVTVQGLVRGSRSEVRSGLRTLWTGVLLFLVLGAFFEGVVHLSHLDFGVYGRMFVPAVLILAGVALLLRRRRF